MLDEKEETLQVNIDRIKIFFSKENKLKNIYTRKKEHNLL